MKVVQLLLIVSVAQSNSAGGSNLLCSCSLNHDNSKNLLVSCSKTMNEDAGVSCSKEVLPRISRGYRYVPGYGLFKLFGIMKPWQKAKKTCELDGGNLYIPKDSQLPPILFNIFNKVQAFTGLSDSTSEGIYVGVDRKVYVDLKWMPGEPNGKRVENCVTVVYDGLLNDISCGYSLPFICERHLTSLPPEGYVYSDGFGFYKVYGERSSFAEAQKVCERDGVNLAVPETYDEAEAIVSVLKDDAQRLDELWIGLNDTVQEGRFTTVSGRPLSSLEFDNWRENEPNNQNNENCVLFYQAGTINDDNCDKKFPFICELSL